MRLYQCRVVTKDGRKVAMVFAARDDDDAIDQLHQCHRSWRVFRPMISCLELWRYKPGHFDPPTARWTSTATRLVASIAVKPEVESKDQGTSP